MVLLDFYLVLKISSNENLVDIASRILDVKKEELLVQEPTCLINLPKTKESCTIGIMLKIFILKEINI